MNISETNLQTSPLTLDDNFTTPALELDPIYTGLVGALLACICFTTAVGNGLVVLAVAKDRKLHQCLANKLVASLAVCDFTVGVLVMPLAAVPLIYKRWPFGSVVCNIFIALDVTCCTSSILHLVAISLDRFWTVTDLTYTRGNKKQKYFLPVAVCSTWLLSGLICFPPFFFLETEQKPGECMINQNRTYTIYSTVGAFYLPLIVIIVIYTKIFLVVRQRVRKKAFRKRNVHTIIHTVVEISADDDKTIGEEELASETLLSKPIAEHIITSDTFESLAEEADTPDTGSTPLSPHHNSLPFQPTTGSRETSHRTLSSKMSATSDLSQDIPNRRRSSGKAESHNSSVREGKLNVNTLIRHLASLTKTRKDKGQDKLAAKREHKALRTLLLITGIFIACWLPFFTVTTFLPFCPVVCENFPKLAFDLVTWLGYFNSMVDPIIYTIFSPDFRRAFKRMISSSWCKSVSCSYV